MSQQTKKVTPKALTVAVSAIVAVQAASLAITGSNSPTYTSIGYSYQPFGSSTVAAALNVSVYVVLVFVMTLALVWIVRMRMILSFKFLIFTTTAVSTFLLTLITVDGAIPPQVNPSAALALEIAISLLPVVGLGFTVFVRDIPAVSFVVLGFLAAEVGSFLASTLPPATALLLPAAFAAYDIYAVFRGPLKQLVTALPSSLAGMSVKVGEFTIGLGDLVFYSMLPSMALFYSDTLCSITVLAAVDSGFIITLGFLARRRLLPGLPIPVLLGLSFLLVCGIL